MALKVYVISHSIVGASSGSVLAAFSARDGADTTQLLADVVGAGLPLSVAPPAIAPPVTPYVIDPSMLRVDEATSEDPATIDPSSVLFAPWTYVAAFDPNTGKFQSLSKGSPPQLTGQTATPPLALNATLPAAIAPTASVPGLLQLYVSGSGATQPAQPVTFKSSASTFGTAVSTSFTPLAGADSAMLLVVGCAAYFGTFPTTT